MWFFGFQKKRKVAERYDAGYPGVAFASRTPHCQSPSIRPSLTHPRSNHISAPPANPYSQPYYSIGGGAAVYINQPRYYPVAYPPPPRYMAERPYHSNRHPPAPVPHYPSAPTRSGGRSTQSSSVATGSDLSPRSYASQSGRPIPASGRRVPFGRVDVREFGGGRRGGGRT